MKSRLFLFSAFLYLIFRTAAAGFIPNASSIPPSLIRAAGPWTKFYKLANCSRGDRLNDLSSLKRYFHNFGYIPDSKNFTDTFDDDMESALKMYQRNFNLNPTGRLDSATLTSVIRPRCGVPDVINGSTTMNSRRSTPVAAGFHAVAHYTFFPGSPRWNTRDLTYVFLTRNGLPDDVRSLFRKAFDRWSAVARLNFTELPSSSYLQSDIRIGFYAGDHGDGEPFDGILGTLAHAFSPPSGRLHFDGEEEWLIHEGNSTTAASSRIAVDLESVAVHEIGHVLGLGHSSVESSIMYPSITAGTRRVELGDDDIQGIQELYGSNPSYDGISAVTPTPTSDRETESSGNTGDRFRRPLWQTLVLSIFIIIGL